MPSEYRFLNLVCIQMSGKILIQKYHCPRSTQFQISVGPKSHHLIGCPMESWSGGGTEGCHEGAADGKNLSPSPAPWFQRGLPLGVPMGQPQGSLLFHLPSSSLPCLVLSCLLLGLLCVPGWDISFFGGSTPQTSPRSGALQANHAKLWAERPALHQVKKGKKEGLRGPSLCPGPIYKAAQVTDTPPGRCGAHTRSLNRPVLPDAGRRCFPQRSGKAPG